MTEDIPPIDDDDRPFSRSERAALRKIIEDDRRARWLRATIRLWLAGIAGVIAFLISIKDYIRGAFKGVIGS